MLLFKSIYRNRETVPAKEFANVVGRVGRAFVDLDGLYILPIFETGNKGVAKVHAFRKLARDAQKRQLESGVRDLIRIIISILTNRLGCDAQALAEYVLNMNSTWVVPERETDEYHAILDTALNELDTAIFGIIDVLDLPTDEVANYLDDCLQSSYWQRRLKNADAGDRELQGKVIRGRAVWLWSNSGPESRRAYFASGVGYKAGTTIEGSLDRLEEYLSAAESALAKGDTVDAGQQTASAAEILFKIGPFVPRSTVMDLPAVLHHWLSGAPLAEYADKEAIGFIQEEIVYRLVWAIEATRLHLQHVRTGSDESAGNLLALCLTYGVPCVKAALLMQGGIRSRAVATKAAVLIEEDIGDFKQLRSWIRKLRSRQVNGPSWETDPESKEWDMFLARFGHRDQRKSSPKRVLLHASWHNAKMPKQKTTVRVSRIENNASALISTISCLPLGTTTLPDEVQGKHFIGRVQSGGQTISILANLRSS